MGCQFRQLMVSVNTYLKSFNSIPNVTTNILILIVVIKAEIRSITLTPPRTKIKTNRYKDLSSSERYIHTINHNNVKMFMNVYDSN